MIKYNNDENSTKSYTKRLYAKEVNRRLFEIFALGTGMELSASEAVSIVKEEIKKFI
jgi:hypothetical protein